LVLALVASSMPTAALPGTRAPRIVSINPCIDAVLMEVADPAQILAISHYSHDPRATSIRLAEARRFRATSGTAEEVVALAPDVVISGPHVAPATIAALKRMRIELVQYPVPESVSESIVQVRDIARIAGHPGRGAALTARIDAAARPVRPLPFSGSVSAPVSALVWQSGGLVPGAKTLTDDLLRRAGFRNMSAAYGLKKWDVLPLEHLVARPPHVLLSTRASHAATDRVAAHPALRRLAHRIVVADYPTRLMNCGGPTIIAAMARLRQIRRQVTP
jgi:iron complex transport system substrate-binding protein